jgi:predicted site-specific integrase-resolvase
MQSISQAAKSWGVSQSCVRLWIKRGLIQAARLGERATMVIDVNPPPAQQKGRPKKNGTKSD